MPEFILDYQEYIIFGIAYFTFCAIAKRFIEFFIELKEKTINSQKELREKFESEYKENAKKPWEKYKSSASSLGKERSYYFTMLGLSIILVIVNAFIFLAMLSTLSTLIAYAFCAIAEFKFTKTDQNNKKRVNALILSCVTFTYAFFAIWGAGIQTIIYSLILILIGMPIYLFKK